jgi:hypothetical protein
MMKGEPTRLRCSFCNKSDADVRKLIRGESGYICDECVAVCVDILDEHSADKFKVEAPKSETDPTPVVTCRLCGMQWPREDSLLVPEHGFLCPACTTVVETSLARRTKES